MTRPMPDNAAADRALVLFSGGQDSATCLAWALSRFERVETVAFDYRQPGARVVPQLRQSRAIVIAEGE